MFQWDDLRLFIAAARFGSFTEAAKQVGADTATVSRHVGRLETALKATLFVRSPSGLKLTATGRRLYADGQHAEQAMVAVERNLQDDNLEGTVRISTSEGFGGRVLAPALAELSRIKPDLRIELAANAGFLSPTLREVEIAVTLNAPKEARLIVEPLTEYRLGLFCADSYAAQRGHPQTVDDLLDHRIVGYVDDLIYTSELRYLAEIHPLLTPSISSSSINAQRRMVMAGAGIGVLPYFLADGLQPVLPEAVALTRRFWVSTHKDVAATSRARFLRRWLQDVVKDRARLLLELPPGQPPEQPEAGAGMRAVS